MADDPKPQTPPVTDQTDKPIIAQGPSIMIESINPPLNDKPIIIQRSVTHLDSED